MQIEVLIKRVYGKERFYPVNEIAKTICRVLQSQTLTKDQLLIFKQDGWTVIIQTEKYELE
jgi:hypothetical protein